jgi:hypothetical protein
MIVLGVPGAACVWLVGDAVRSLRARRLDPRFLPGALAVVTLGAMLATPYGGVPTTRYLLPLFTALPTAVALWLVHGIGWRAGAPLLALLLGVHVYGHARLARPEPPAVEADVAALLAAGVRHAYADQHTGAVLTHYSREALVVTDFAREWYPLAELASFDRPAVILPAPEPAIRDALALVGIEMVERRAGRYLVYLPSAVRGEARAPLPVAGARAAAWPNPEVAHRAIDGDLATRWGSAAPQRAGMWFHVDLGALHVVNGVRLELGAFTADFPRTLAIEVSSDGLRWTTVGKTAGYFRPGVEVAGNTYWFRPTFFGRTPDLESAHNAPDVRFAATAARFVRVRLPDPPGGPLRTAFDWSIAEYRVFGPAVLRYPSSPITRCPRRSFARACLTPSSGSKA